MRFFRIRSSDAATFSSRFVSKRGSEMGELLHLLHTIRHVGHVVAKAADKVLDGPDDGERR